MRKWKNIFPFCVDCNSTPIQSCAWSYSVRFLQVNNVQVHVFDDLLAFLSNTLLLQKFKMHRMCFAIFNCWRQSSTFRSRKRGKIRYICHFMAGMKASMEDTGTQNDKRIAALFNFLLSLEWEFSSKTRIWQNIFACNYWLSPSVTIDHVVWSQHLRCIIRFETGSVRIWEEHFTV